MKRFTIDDLRIAGSRSMTITICAALFLTLFIMALQTAGAQESAPTGDVANGIVIFQQRCANCHGITGLGDGQMAAQAVNPPTPLANPE